ncbi:unnamed protein product [Pleuronectes platessa]|uniref:Uncharacterized protein n=1 Tax=Pleuronectes platessa TaxID=8262 RepID=A0A9N7TYD5_PLEPL|nr:unnamed protein product [Pleuronectes platessa]
MALLVRLRSIRTKTARHKTSFFPAAVGLINKAQDPHLTLTFTPPPHPKDVLLIMMMAATCVAAALVQLIGSLHSSSAYHSRGLQNKGSKPSKFLADFDFRPNVKEHHLPERLEVSPELPEHTGLIYRSQHWGCLTFSFPSFEYV